MFYKYLILNLNNKEILYLFLDNKYEISSEFPKDIKNDNIQEKIRGYINDSNINFEKGTIYLVTNNIIAASINYNNDDFGKINKYIDINEKNNSLEIIDISSINNNEKVLIKSKNNYYRMELIKYLENSLFNKIPSIFEKEAMKAIAIIIRSNYIKDLYNYGYIKDENNYIIKGISDIEKSNRYKFFIDKLINSIEETNMMYLTFKSKPIYVNAGNILSINQLALKGYNYSEIIKMLYPKLKLYTEY